MARSLTTFALAIKVASSRSPQKALSIYSLMHRNCAPFDTFSILYTLKACAKLHDVVLNKHLHAHIIKLGFNSHVYVATSLLHAYVVSSFADACKLFDEMPERNVVTWNTMIAGYSRSGDLEKANSVFGEIPERDLTSWSTMIAAYINSRNYERGLSLFRDMVINEGLNPDEVAAGAVLSGCALLGSLGFLEGKSVHGFVAKNGWHLSVQLGTILVDMYAKCGSMKCAIHVFELMRERNILTWTVLVCGIARLGYGTEALSRFETMQREGVRPNEVTFTRILRACADGGLVEEGPRFFEMIEECGLQPEIQHYGCMVDLYGKVGLVEEAYEVIKGMKLKPNIVVWTSFLYACKEHGKFEMGERVIEQVLSDVKPENNDGIYTLICDLYALAGNLDAAERVMKLIFRGRQHQNKLKGSNFC